MHWIYLIHDFHNFELNYWNKWTFPRHSNLLRCTCTCCIRDLVYASFTTVRIQSDFSIISAWYQICFQLTRRGTILRIAGKRAQAEYNGKCCSDWLCELREEDVVYIPTLMVLLTLRQCQLTSQSSEQLITIVYWQSGNCKHGSTVSFEACIINFAHKCSVMFYWQAGTELSLDFGY